MKFTKTMLQFNKQDLIDFTKDEVFQSNIFIKFGYTSDPNGRVRKQIREYYDYHGLNLKQILSDNLFEHKVCPVCGTTFSCRRSEPKTTCSYACSNTHFRSGSNNGSYKKDEDVGYRIVCFRHHVKKCVCCDETLMVEAHHYDGNHNNNKPDNFVPLCPTHHQYIHSRHSHLIQDVVDKYVVDWKMDN